MSPNTRPWLALCALESRTVPTTWTGLGGDNLWSNVQNWSNGLPASFGTAEFPDMGGQVEIINDVSGNPTGVSINAAGDYTIRNATGTSQPQYQDSKVTVTDGSFNIQADFRDLLATVSGADSLLTLNGDVVGVNVGGGGAAVGGQLAARTISGVGGVGVGGKATVKIGGFPGTELFISSFGKLTVGSDSAVRVSGRGSGRDLILEGPSSVMEFDFSGPVAPFLDFGFGDEANLRLDGRLVVTPPSNPVAGVPLRLISNSLSTPILGQFVGVSEGSFLPTSDPTTAYRISYAGGDGNNDVTMTPLTRPTASISPTLGQPATVRSGPVLYDLRYSAPVAVASLAANDFTVTAPNPATTPPGMQVLPLNASGGFATQFRVVVENLIGQGPVTTKVLTAAAITADGVPSRGGDKATVQFDEVGPTVTLTSTAAAVTSANPIRVTVDLSETPAAPLTMNAFTVTNGTVANFDGSGKRYTFDLRPTAAGEVRVSAATGAIRDAAGNPSPAVELRRVFDPVAPTVTVARADGQPDPTTDPRVAFTVTFSEPVTGLPAGALQASNGTVAVFPAGDGRTFRVEVFGLTADGEVRLTVPAGTAGDPAGNKTAAAGSAILRRFASPALVLVDGVADGTNATLGKGLDIRARFGRPVTGFTIEDLQVIGGEVSKFKAVSDREFEFTLTPKTLGRMTLVVEGGAVKDLFGYPATGDSLFRTVVGAFARVGPTLARTAPAVNPAEVDPPPKTPNPLLVGTDRYAAGANGSYQMFDAAGTWLSSDVPFGDEVRGVRTASADFNNDGVSDLVIGTGPGVVTDVRVLDGRSGDVLFRVQPFEAAFHGGVFVAAGDINIDGLPDLVVTPDEGGGPRIDVFSGKGFVKLASFFGIDDPNFRGGARAAVGDVNGDDRGDVVVSAGFGGGPRIAGANLAAGRFVKLFADFFAFENTLRNGAFMAVGDLDADGKADLVFGGGPGGGPRVLGLSAAGLLNGNTQTVLTSFFAGDTVNRTGARVAVKDLDGDSRADLVTSSGDGSRNTVLTYLDTELDGPSPRPLRSQADFPGADAVFVG